MKLNIYVIHDKVAVESGQIIECKNDGVAIRTFYNILGNQKADINEFGLIHLGSIDHDTNEIELVQQRLVEINLNTEIEQ